MAAKTRIAPIIRGRSAMTIPGGPLIAVRPMFLQIFRSIRKERGPRVSTIQKPLKDRTGLFIKESFEPTTTQRLERRHKHSLETPSAPVVQEMRRQPII